MRAALFAALLLSTPAMAAPYPEPDPKRIDSVFDGTGDIDGWLLYLPKDGRTFGVSVITHCHNKRLELRDAANHILKTSAPALPEQNAFVEWLPKYTGDYRIVVTDTPVPSNYTCAEQESPDYTVLIAESCAASPSTVCKLPQPPSGYSISAKSGVLRSVEDRNWYRFTVDKRRPVLLAVHGNFDDTRPAVVTMRDAKGRFIVDNTTVAPLPGYNGNCILGYACVWADLCPGTYYAAVRGDGITYAVGYELETRVYPVKPGPCP